MFKLETACRTCMKSCIGTTSLFQTFKMEGKGRIMLATALMSVSNSQVSQNDGLPQNICTQCVKLLQICYSFYNQVQKTEETLKKILRLQADVKDEIKSDDDFDDSGSYDYGNDNLTKDFVNDLPKHLINDIVPKIESVVVYDDDYKAGITEKSASCSICNKEFKKQSWLDKHMSKHESEKPLTEEMIENISYPNVKVKNETDSKFMCLECGLVFDKSHSLSMHKKKHKTSQLQTKFVCDFCQQSFNRKTILARHLKLHSHELPFQCTHCPQRYSRQDQLNVHNIDKHNGAKPNACPYCNKAFTQLCSLKDHIRTHTRETPYLCSICGKRFSNGSNLRQHMRRHSGLKPFACSLCPKTFCTKGQMKCHQATHSNAHPYTCETCGATFTKPNSLKKHQLIHLGIRPFQCDTCDMKFTCKDHLKRHYRIHTGEKPYKCRYCERAFTQSNDLVKHMRTHLGLNVYECVVCTKRFRLLSELKAHYPQHYGDSAPAPAERPSKSSLEDAKELAVAVAKIEQPEEVVALEPPPGNRITITFAKTETSQLGDITININPDNT